MIEAMTFGIGLCDQVKQKGGFNTFEELPPNNKLRILTKILELAG